MAILWKANRENRIIALNADICGRTIGRFSHSHSNTASGNKIKIEEIII